MLMVKELLDTSRSQNPKSPEGPEGGSEEIGPELGSGFRLDAGQVWQGNFSDPGLDAVGQGSHAAPQLLLGQSHGH